MAASHGDYLAVVRRRAAVLDPPVSANQRPPESARLENKQYLVLQTTYRMDEDGEPVQVPDRFGVALPERDLARCQIPPSTEWRVWSTPAVPSNYITRLVAAKKRVAW